MADHRAAERVSCITPGCVAQALCSLHSTLQYTPCQWRATTTLTTDFPKPIECILNLLLLQACAASAQQCHWYQHAEFAELRLRTSWPLALPSVMSPTPITLLGAVLRAQEAPWLKRAWRSSGLKGQ